MNTGPTEFFNISNTLLSVLQQIASGVLHRRDIEDNLRISEKHCIRAIDKLEGAGLVRTESARDAGRGNKNVRIYRCHPTENGNLMLRVCEGIEKYRG